MIHECLLHDITEPCPADLAEMRPVGPDPFVEDSIRF